jgi:L-seryl-tRNA(Ser) seleniumtransferase
MIAADVTTLGRRVQGWQAALQRHLPLEQVSLEIIDSLSTVGGGSLPGQTLPTKALAITSPSVDALAEKLRGVTQSLPIIARIEEDRLLLDPRTVLPSQDELVIEALSAVLLALSV